MNDELISELEAILSWLNDLRQKTTDPTRSLISNAESLLAEAKAKLPRHL